MTNEEIIYNARKQLAKDGKIAVSPEGQPEEIHTYDNWKKLGYHVLKGEKAICKLSIWKPVSKKKKQEQEQEVPEDERTPWMVPKTAFFFSRSQVDELVRV